MCYVMLNQRCPGKPTWTRQTPAQDGLGMGDGWRGESSFANYVQNEKLLLHHSYSLTPFLRTPC